MKTLPFARLAPMVVTITGVFNYHREMNLEKSTERIYVLLIAKTPSTWDVYPYYINEKSVTV